MPASPGITVSPLSLPLSIVNGGTGSTTGYSQALKVQKFAIANADVVALGAVTAGDITCFTLAANEFAVYSWVNVTGAGGGTTALTMALGITGALYIDWLIAQDVKTAPVQFGLLTAARGTGFPIGSVAIPSYSGTTLVKAHFISTVQNLSAVTGFAATAYLVTGIVP